MLGPYGGNDGGQHGIDAGRLRSRQKTIFHHAAAPRSYEIGYSNVT